MSITGWHLTRPQGDLLRNAFLGKGHLHSVSSIVAMTGITGFVSEYQILNRQRDKEALWEEIRQRVAPDRPSRQGALFLFESHEAANSAQERWFQNEGRVLLRVHIPPPPDALTHRADAAWLNLPEADWSRAADSYWRGFLTQAPSIELIVHGVVFFPDWERPPFGRLAPNPRAT